MTTYISRNIPLSMLPESGVIRHSPLSTGKLKDRTAKVEVVNLIGPGPFRDLVERDGLRLPLLTILDDTAKLQPGDEVFVAHIEGEGMVFSRLRIPVRVEVRAPFGVPQAVFNEVVDHAHAIALWQRGVDWLKDLAQLKRDYFAEHDEFNVAWDAWMKSSYAQRSNEHCDIMLEWSDMAYKALCSRYAGEVDNSNSLWQHARRQADENFDIAEGLDIMLAKYARRASGEGKDLAAERELARPLIRQYPPYPWEG